MSCKHSNRAARDNALSYLGLVAAGEPFRLLFPLGTAIGIFGVAMWPLNVWSGYTLFPAVRIFHPRVMIEGFLAAFVMGFLGTALPRMLDAPRLRLGESVMFATGLAACTALHAAGALAGGDMVFLATMCAFLFALGVRVRLRKDVPPPAFVLVAMGMVCAVAGVGLQLAINTGVVTGGGFSILLGRLLLNQAFLLLPVMGVGAFLLPRFFGLPNRQSYPESMQPPPGWVRRAGFALVCGLVVAGGFVLEALGQVRLGCALRAVVVAMFFWREVPFHKGGLGGGSLASALRVALISVPLGYVLMAVLPDRVFSLLHVVFISGFSLLAFAVASRVVLGHSGQADKFQTRLWPVRILAILVVAAMLARVSADWLPAMTMKHYAYAAVLWIAGVVVWAASILPGVRRPDPD